MSSWFYPKPTGDLGRDRNARTLQFTCLLFGFVIALIAVLNTISREAVDLSVLSMSLLGLIAAMVMNHSGRWEGAARLAILAILLAAVMLIVNARDGFRSNAIIVFPGLLLIAVILRDRASYVATATPESANTGRYEYYVQSNGIVRSSRAGAAE